MKKALALFCCVAVLFAFAGYDWGNKQEVKKPVAAPPPPASSDPITALNNLLGSGTPAERQAKLDTLVRLSQIMPLVAPQGVVTANAPAQKAATASVAQTTAATTAKKSSSRW